MVTSLTETSNETNKSSFKNICVLLFISNLNLKKCKQFVGELKTLVFLIFKKTNFLFFVCVKVK